MIDQADIAHITLALLRKVDQRTERMAEDLHDLEVRMSAVEANIAQVNRRVDRFAEPLERNEGRANFRCAGTSRRGEAPSTVGACYSPSRTTPFFGRSVGAAQIGSVRKMVIEVEHGQV